MPSSAAERQKRYRERMKSENPSKFKEMQRKTAYRNYKNRKRIADFGPEDQARLRSQWREIKKKKKDDEKKRERSECLTETKEKRTEAQLNKWRVNHNTRKNFLSRLKKARSQTEGESVNFESEISDPVIEDAEDPLANEVKLKVDSDSEPDETPDDVLEVLPPEMVQEQMALAHNIKNEPSHSSGPSSSFGENDYVDTEDLQQVNSKRIEEREEELHRLQVAEGEWLVKAAKEAYLKAKLERESAEELLRFRKTKREEAESKMNKD